MKTIAWKIGSVTSFKRDTLVQIHKTKNLEYLAQGRLKRDIKQISKQLLSCF